MILRMLDKEGRTTYIIHLDAFMDFYVENDKRVNGEPTVVGWSPNGKEIPTENIFSFDTEKEAYDFLGYIGNCYVENKRCINFHKDTQTYESV